MDEPQACESGLCVQGIPEVNKPVFMALSPALIR